MKNNVTRLLDSRKITYKTLEASPIKRSAVESAELFGLDPMIVYKTIVIQRMEKGKAILAVVPGPLEVDPKKVALAIGEKKVKVTTQNEAESLTKLLSGGISALALINHGFQVLLSEHARNQPEIAVSGGQRGLSILLSPEDFVTLTMAQYADLTTD